MVFSFTDYISLTYHFVSRGVHRDTIDKVIYFRAWYIYKTTFFLNYMRNVERWNPFTCCVSSCPNQQYIASTNNSSPYVTIP
jgi:hypothetical protein